MLVKTYDTREIAYEERDNSWENSMIYSDGEREIKLSHYIDTYDKYCILLNDRKLRTIDIQQFNDSRHAANELRVCIEEKLKASS